MADNQNIDPGTTPSVPIAADDIAGVKYQRVKIAVGADGVAADATSANPLPVDDDGTQTALASILAALPAALAAHGGLKIEGVASGVPIPVSGAAAGTEFAEDAPHTTGDAGTMALGVRKDTATALAGTDGDYTPLITDASGRQHVNVGTSVLPTGAATETTVAAVNTAVGATGDAASSTTGSVIAHLRKIRDVLIGALPTALGSNGGMKIEGVASGTAVPVSVATIPSHAVTNAGTFAVQADTELTTADLDTGAGTDTRAVVGLALAASGGATVISAANPLPVTGGTSSTQFAEDAAHVSGDAGTMALAVRNDAGTALAGTTGDYIPLSTDASGNLRVTGGGGGTQFAEDAAHVSGDLGTMALGVRKDTATALAGTDGDYQPAIFDASGRQHVNVGTSALPTGAATAAKQPALGTAGASASDVISVQGIASGTPMPISGSITASGTFPVDSSHAEDAAHVSGDLGAFMLGVRKDTATQLAGTDGDYSPIITDASGRQHVNVGTSVLPTGASTETTLGSVLTGVGTPSDAAATTTGSIIAQLRRIANAIVGTLTVSGTVTANAGTGTLAVSQANPVQAATATLANVAGSASSVTLQASNAARKGLVIVNDSTAILRIKFGATASATDYTYFLAGSVGGVPATLELPAMTYTGRVDGIWASATGTARVTELT